MVGPSVIGTAAAGKQLTGLSGTLGRVRRDHLPLPVVSLQRRRRRVPLDPRRDLADLRARRQGRREDARADRLRDRLDRHGVGLLEPRSGRSPHSGRCSSRPPSRSSPGPPVVGKTIQVTTGTWSPTPPKLTYRWERCNANGRVCAAIPNATTSSYTIAGADLGHALARDRPGHERLDDPERLQHRDARRSSAHAGHGPVATSARSSTAPRSSGSSSSRRPGSGRASGRSRSPSAGTAATRRARTARRFPAPPRTSTRSAQRTSGRRSGSR